MRSSGLLRISAAFSVIGLVAGLAGCNSNQQTDAGAAVGVPSLPSTISADSLVGKWGVAAYHRDSDRPRTEGEARRQCSNPYVIKKGPNGGLMMHLADESQPQELVLKGSASGVTYLGLPATTGLPCIDYVIADHFLIPESHAAFYTEKPLYMPDVYQVCDRQRVAGPRPTDAHHRDRRRHLQGQPGRGRGGHGQH